MNPNYPPTSNQQQALYQQMLLAQQAGGMTQAQAQQQQQQQRQLLQQQQQQQVQPRGAVGLGTSSRGPAATMSAAEQQRQIAMLNQFAVRQQQQQQQQQQIGYGQHPQQQPGGMTVPAVAGAPQPAPASAPPAQSQPAPATAAAPQQPQAPQPISTELLQTYLDENQMLLEAIVQQQNHGKLQNTLQYQLKLQQNLLFLATLADANPPK